MADVIDGGAMKLCSRCGGRHVIASSQYSAQYDGYKQDCPQCAGTGKEWRWHDDAINEQPKYRAKPCS